MSQPSSEGCPVENGLILEAPLQKSSHRAGKKTSWRKEKKLDLRETTSCLKEKPLCRLSWREGKPDEKNLQCLYA